MGKSSPPCEQRSAASTPSPPCFPAGFLVPPGQPTGTLPLVPAAQPGGGDRAVQGLDNPSFAHLGEDGPREATWLQKHETHQLLRFLQFLLKTICEALEEQHRLLFLLRTKGSLSQKGERAASHRLESFAWSTAKRRGTGDPSLHQLEKKLDFALLRLVKKKNPEGQEIPTEREREPAQGSSSQGKDCRCSQKPTCDQPGKLRHSGLQQPPRRGGGFLVAVS